MGPASHLSMCNLYPGSWWLRGRLCACLHGLNYQAWSSQMCPYCHAVIRGRCRP